MSLSDTHRRMLQKLMTDPNWSGFEVFFHEFMEKRFMEASIKRDTEFDTVWYAAEQEGAKRALLDFKKQMEQEAHKV